MCPGGVSGRAVVAVQIAAANPPTPTVVWCAPMSSPTTGPIATTTDGQADAIVWYMSGGRLMGVDGDTGASIYASATSDTCSGVRQLDLTDRGQRTYRRRRRHPPLLLVR